MTLHRAPNGIWHGYFDFKGFDRLHLSMRTTKKAEAKERHDAVRILFRQRRYDMIAQLRGRELSVERLAAMIAHGEPLEPIAAPVEAPSEDQEWGTVGDAIDRYLDWIEAHPKKSAGTHMTVSAQLKRFREYVHEGTPVAELPVARVTSAVFEAYQKSLVDAGTPGNTVTAYAGRVRALWRWLERQELRAAREERRAARPVYNPVDSEMVVRESHRRDRRLSEDEAERLLAATPEPLLAVVAIGLLAGFRLGEVLHLRAEEDVDLELGTLAVRIQTDWRPKTRRSVRVVPMTPDLKPIVEHHLVRYASDRWLVPSLADPELPFNDRTFQTHFTAIVRRAGLPTGRKDPAGVTFHTLRHTFASWLAMRGVDLYTIAQLLGDRLEEVERTYAHLSPDFKRTAISKLSGAVKLPAMELATNAME